MQKLNTFREWGKCFHIGLSEANKRNCTDVTTVIHLFSTSHFITDKSTVHLKSD